MNETTPTSQLVRKRQLATLMSTLPYGSLFSNWSVKIINELDRCSRDAQDILLSYLDKLPPGKALIGTSNL